VKTHLAAVFNTKLWRELCNNSARLHYHEAIVLIPNCQNQTHNIPNSVQGRARWPCYHGEARGQMRGTRKLPKTMESKKKEPLATARLRGEHTGWFPLLPGTPRTNIHAKPVRSVSCRFENFFRLYAAQVRKCRVI
jgi:hypothetical protein